MVEKSQDLVTPKETSKKDKNKEDKKDKKKDDKISDEEEMEYEDEVLALSAESSDDERKNEVNLT